MTEKNETECCGILERLGKEYDLPFYRPLMLDQDHNVVAGGWSVRLLALTPSGNVSKRSHTTVRLNFCPFCGKELEE